MKIAICDDERIYFHELNNLLNEYSRQRKVDVLTYYFSCGQQLLTSNIKFDLIFMDYQMEDLNGMDTSRIIRSYNKNIAIIFLTNYPSVVFESFEVDTFRFLVKPIQKPELFNSLDAYIDSVDCDDFLIIKTINDVWKVRLSQIVYAESHGKHTIIRTTEGSFECSRYLCEIEGMLPKEKFFRSHRTFISSFFHIRNHDNQIIYFNNNERGKIGKTYLTSFKKAFQDYIARYNSKDW